MMNGKLRLIGRAFQYAYRYWRAYPFLVLTSVVFVIAVSGVNILIPWLVDEIARDISQTKTYNIWEVGGLFAILASLPVMLFIRDRSWGKACARIMGDLTMDNFAHILSLDSEWHANKASGAILKDINKGISSIERFSDRMLYTFLPVILVSIGMSISLLQNENGWMFVAFLVIYLTFTIWHSLAYVMPPYIQASILDSEFIGEVADSLAGNSVVRAFAHEDMEVKRINGLCRHWLSVLESAWRQSQWNNVIRQGLLSMMLIVPLAFSLRHISATTLADVAFLTTSWLSLRSYVIELGSEIRHQLNDISCLAGVMTIMETKSEVIDYSNESLMVDRGKIEWRHVSYAYPERPPVFQDFSLEVSPGETVALVGASGSGKSTLIKLLMRLHDVQGQILIDDQDISHYTMASLRKNIAIVQQEPVLFHRNIMENIRYANLQASDEEVIRAAKLAYADDFINLLPQGYQTLVGEHGVKLSGGERQRIVIARAILADKPILVMDEATSALDNESEHLVAQAIEHVCQDRTSIIIAHRLSTVKRAHRIIVMQDGRIVEQGTHDALMEMGGHYTRLISHELH